LTTSFQYWKLVVILLLDSVQDMSSETTQLMSETVVAVFRANGRMLEWGDTFTEPFGLTSARWQMLGALAWSGEKLTAPQIAEQMGVSRQGAQKQLNLLLVDKLVERLSNPSHRRSPTYQLTRQGEALFQQVNAAWELHAKAAGQRFSNTDLATTLRVLNELANLHTQPYQGENDEA
jgi:DNA-binding MarR family transcriptional regulator